MSTPTALRQATVSVDEAARFLGISRRSAYRAAASGELPAVRIGGRIVVSRDRLLEMVNGRSEEEPVRAGDSP